MKPTLLIIQIICAAFLGAVTGLPNKLNERVIGGGEATLGQFPFVVSVIENGNSHLCGGFIYGLKWIVTAASCVNGKSPSALRVMVGLVDFGVATVPEQNITVFNIIPFDQYDNTFVVNDIAILQLTRSINFDANVAFIKYDEVDPANQLGQIIGWGATSSEEASSSETLRYGAVYLQEETNIYCGDYTANEYKPFSMLCAVASNSSDPSVSGTACHYDEGSPLVQTNAANQYIAVGIMSKTSACSLDSPSVYTRLSYFYSWLYSVAGPQPNIASTR